MATKWEQIEAARARAAANLPSTPGGQEGRDPQQYDPEWLPDGPREDRLPPPDDVFSEPVDPEGNPIRTADPSNIRNDVFTGDPGATDPGEGDGGGGGEGQGGGSGGNQPAGPSTLSGPSQYQDTIRSMLLEQLRGLSTPPSADDPYIQNVMQAHEFSQNRIRQQRRSADAERLHQSGQGAVEGGSSGALETNISSGFQDMATNLGGLQAQLFRDEMLSRRSALTQLLSIATQSGDAEAQRDLQYKLALMDNELRKYGIDIGNQQFYDQLGFNIADREMFYNDRAADRAVG